MARLLIIYHSRTGGTEQMVKAAFEAAKKECDTQLLKAGHANPDDLLSVDGYIFAAPENLASLSGDMKEFFDRCYYPILGKIEGRPYGLMICAGSDGEGAVRQTTRICTGWRLKPVQEPLIICTHAQTEADILAPKTISDVNLERCRDFGASLATGLTMGIF